MRDKLLDPKEWIEVWEAFDKADAQQDKEHFKKMYHKQLELAEKRAAQEAYLECLREECGEGPCAEAIRTKFNLKL